MLAVAWLFAGRPELASDWADQALQPSEPSGTLLLLLSFSGLMLGAMLAARLMHKRMGRTLFGPKTRVLRDFVRAFSAVGILMIVSLVLWSVSYDALPNLDFRVWLTLLPFTVLGLLIQTGAEEAVFRGYLQQQLAARFRETWVWLFIPSFLFGIVHYNPATSPEATWLVIIAASLFGLAAADLTARTGSLGAAWGFHFANNFFAVALLSTEGTITGLSLYRTPYSIDQTAQFDVLLFLDLGFLVLAWWLVRRVVER